MVADEEKALEVSAQNQAREVLLDTGTSAPSAVSGRALQQAFLQFVTDRKWLDLPHALRLS
jgi:hypothetical protein